MITKQHAQVGLMPKVSKDKTKVYSELKYQLEIIDSFKQLVENGSVQEFVLMGIDDNGQLSLASYCSETVSGVGLIELGKFAFINQQTNSDE